MKKVPFHHAASRVFRLLTVSSVLIGTLALGSLALSSFETPEAVSDAETTVSASDTTLAATEYIVRYNSNGGYNPPAQQIKKSGETLILTEAVPNSPGWTFCGWSKTADGEVAYKPGARYTSNSSVTLYAVWECNGVYDNLTYSLKKRNGVMTITGQGEMKRREDEPFPWEELCKSITEITIGSGITSIETEAFANASGLTKVTFPTSLKKIGDSAFYACTSLKTASLPSALESVGSGAFIGCTSLTKMALPKTLKELGAYAFAYTGITSVTLAMDIEYLPQGLFYKCSKLARATISCPNLKLIGSEVFYHCPLTNLTLPNSLLAIGPSAFSGSKLKTLTLPSSLLMIYEKAFESNTLLTSVSFPESLKSIGSSAFSGCSKLTAISLPAPLSEVDSNAFAYCTALQTISVNGTNTLFHDNVFYKTAWYNNQPDGAVYFGPDDCYLYTYKGKNADGVYTIKEGTKHICGQAFYRKHTQTGESLQVNLPEGLLTIGSYAFSSNKMTEIRLPETLRYIGQSAFERTDLAAIDLPASVVQIEIDAFYFCESLKTVTGGENVRYISNDAFWSTPWFSNQPSGLIYLGKAVMCRSLPKQARLTVRPGTFGLADGLFNGTNAFSELVLPSSIGYIGKNSFNWGDKTVRYTGSKEDWEAIQKADIYIDQDADIQFDYVTTLTHILKSNENTFFLIYAYNMAPESAVTLALKKDGRTVDTVNTTLADKARFNADGDGLLVFQTADAADIDTIEVFSMESMASLKPLCVKERATDIEIMPSAAATTLASEAEA